MKLTVSVEHTGDIVNVDVPGDISLGGFKAYVEAETGISPQNQILVLNGEEVKAGDDAVLDTLQLKEFDLILLQNRSHQTSSGSAPQEDPAEAARQQLLSDANLRKTLPPGSDTLLNDPQMFKTWFNEFAKNSGSFIGGSQGNELQRLQGDPDDPENQKRIMELIQQEQIDENMRNALEYSPESFASVSMLYVDVELNGHHVQAFIDSGAKISVLLTKLAETCGVSRLIDKRFKSVLMGVGTSETVGRIHAAQLKVGKNFYSCSFTVADIAEDLIVGLDMLKKHRGIIDLGEDTLVLGGDRIPFLGEADIPKRAFDTPEDAEKFMKQGKSIGAGTSLGGNIFLPDPAAGLNKKAKTEPTKNAGIAAMNRDGTLKYSQATVTQLTLLGFTRDQVLAALDQTNGNPELAASILFQ